MTSTLVKKGREVQQVGVFGIQAQIAQVVGDYAGLGGFRDLELGEVRVLFGYLIPGLKKVTKDG